MKEMNENKFLAWVERAKKESIFVETTKEMSPQEVVEEMKRASYEWLSSYPDPGEFWFAQQLAAFAVVLEEKLA